MNAEMFCEWLALMKYRGHAKSDAEAAKLLGVGYSSLMRWKETGADRRTALACSALLEGLGPFDLVAEGVARVRASSSREDRPALDLPFTVGPIKR